MQSKILICLVFFLFLQAMPVHSADEDVLFPRSQIIKIQVYFWKKIFTEIKVDEGVFHDSELVLPIYRKISLTGLSNREANSQIKQARQEIQEKLSDLAQALERGWNLTASQQELLDKFYVGITPDELRQSMDRIRFQGGLMERFRQGIIRSGAYLPFIQATLHEQRLPLALGYIPHVESSFNLMSHSKTGAKGIWQFVYSTGREYMRVTPYVDERKDPFTSSKASARLLKKNFELLNSWPLAITAYNHGPNGLKRIVETMGTDELGHLIRHYKSRSFNFASKNFYAEIMAAWDVAANYRQYFGELDLDEPIYFQTVRLSHAMSLTSLTALLNYSREEILNLNPALQFPVSQGYVPIPDYYPVKLPYHPSGIQFNPDLARDTEAQVVSSEPRSVVVRSGDTLFGLARANNLTVEELAQLNGIPMDNPVIYPGTTLNLPAVSNEISVEISSRSPLTRYVQVGSGDTLKRIARTYNVDIDDLMTENRITREDSLFPGQSLKLPGKWLPYLKELETTARIRKRVVQRGDSLYSIAVESGISLSKLMQANGLTHTSVIYPGQELVISL
ncbi:MAG: LysM peptidoglycan-binding domain-containing protein [SAR324 cluster bacterium]|nr:LysM peptidoglycan-binding domain-containing protein [SAR324 cluster bacterium]